MAAQPLYREDSFSSPAHLEDLTALSPVEVSSKKTSSRKPSPEKASTPKTRSKTSTEKPKASKTVAKTATRRRSVTKTVAIEDLVTPEAAIVDSAIVDFPTPDNVHSLPVQPVYSRVSHLASVQADSSDQLLDQLAACREVLTALQAESQELHRTMESLAAIAKDMTTLTRPTGIQRLQARTIAPAQPTSPAVKPQSPATRSQQQPTPVPQPVQPASRPNYWGGDLNSQLEKPAATAQTVQKTRSPQLPNFRAVSEPQAIETEIQAEVISELRTSELRTSELNAEAIAKPRFYSTTLRTQHRIANQSLTRQNLEYYAGHQQQDSRSPEATAQPAKPTFRSVNQPIPQPQPAPQPKAQPAIRPTIQSHVQSHVQSHLQPAVKPSLRSIGQTVVRPSVRSNVQTTVQTTVQPTVQPTAQSTVSPAIQAIVKPSFHSKPQPRRQPPARPQQIRIHNPRKRQTLTYLYQVIQQLICIPKGEGPILLDALCWTLSTIGLRLAGQYLVNLIPLLTIPFNLIILSPALLATYLAFCTSKSSSTIVYRCLLTTLGFFIGGKL